MFTTTEINSMMNHHVTYVTNVIRNNNKVSERIRILKGSGYNVKDCYVKDYNRLGGSSIFPKKKEVRIIIGRPKNHFVKEVYAVVLKYGE